MAEVELSQAEADALIAMEKVPENDDPVDYPGLGGSVCVALVSADKRENFLLDVSRGKIDLLKGKYQERGRHVVVLVRLDFGGAPHRNPDGTEIGCPHLHRYRPGYGDKWATPIPGEHFADVSDPWRLLQDFMCFCNVSKPSVIRRGLFS